MYKSPEPAPLPLASTEAKPHPVSRGSVRAPETGLPVSLPPLGGQGARPAATVHFGPSLAANSVAPRLRELLAAIPSGRKAP